MKRDIIKKCKSIGKNNLIYIANALRIYNYWMLLILYQIKVWTFSYSLSIVWVIFSWNKHSIFEKGNEK